MARQVRARTLPRQRALCLTGRPMQFSSHDLYTQLSYYRYLFDHDRQRENLQRKRAPLPRRRRRRRRCRGP